MITVIEALIASTLSALRSRRDLLLENLALRHQLAVLNRTAKHKHLSNGDRLFWSVLCRWWYGWRDALVILRPETVVRWHRAAFKVFWTRRSQRRKPGRPAIADETRKLIRTISRDNPLWGAPRIHGELAKLGIEVAQPTVSKYMLRTRRPPSQTWRTFLKNHAPEIAAIDFFTVATARFRQLYVFVVLAHDRRRVLHFQRDRLPHCRRDGAADRRGISLEHGTPISLNRVPRFLRSRVSLSELCPAPLS